MDEDILKDLGFSGGEIKVYFALLELQEASIGEINKRAQITPSKTYIILDKLIAKGVISYSMKGKIKQFQALNPRKLLEILNERQKKIDMQKKEIEQILPRLEAKKKEKKQFSTVYQGYEGMKTLYDEIIDYCNRNKENFIGFAMQNEEYENDVLMYFFKRYDKIREEMKIKTQLIASNDKIELRKHNSKYLKFKFIDFKLPTGLIIWGDNVAYLSWTEKPSGFVIHSVDVAKSNKDFFKEMWNRGIK